MTIFQSAPYSPRMSFAGAPLAYVAVALCLATIVAVVVRLHVHLRASRQHRIDLHRRARSPFAIGSWMQMEYVMDPRNYQPGTARATIRRVLKYTVVVMVAWMAAFFLATAFIL